MKQFFQKRFFCACLALASGFNLHAGQADVWHWRNPLPQGNDLNGVCYGESRFVAVGNAGATTTSMDATNWVARNSIVTNNLLGVGFGNNLFVAVGTNGTLITSQDGVLWGTQSSGTANALHGVAYGAGLFVVVGRSGTIRTSTDGTNWTSQASGTSQQLYGVTYGEGMFIAVGSAAKFDPQPTELIGLLKALSRSAPSMV